MKLSEQITQGEWQWLGGNAVWGKESHLMIATTVLHKPDSSDDSESSINAMVIAGLPQMLSILERFSEKQFYSQIDDLQIETIQLLKKLNS